MHITIPKFCAVEVKYTLNTLLKDFIKDEINYKIDNSVFDCLIKVGNYSIKLPILFWKDLEPFELNYNLNTLPKTIEENTYEIKGDLFPVVSLYGKNKLVVENSHWIVGFDLIATVFFFLTRWEERVIKSKDIHNRFLVKYSSISNKEFYLRPIVNEIQFFLFAILKEMGVGFNNNKKFTLVPTHDVDIPYYNYGLIPMGKKVVSSLIKLKSSLFIKNIKILFSNKDPYDYHEKFMEDAERLNTKAHFFFMLGGESKHDIQNVQHKNKIEKLIKKVYKRGHVVGYHPSYYTINDNSLFTNEKSFLEEWTQNSLTVGRQHFLRFSVPDTWNIWNDNGMKWDSTMTFPDYAGFRCGTCYPFRVFDFLKRQELDLIERPTIVMDASLKNYEELKPSEACAKIKQLKEKVKFYQGDFVYLWHNSSFEMNGWEDYQEVYETIVQ